MNDGAPADKKPAAPLDYARPMRATRPRKRFLTAAVLALAGCILAVAIILSSVNRPRVYSNRVKCMSNLKQIGLAIELYSNNEKNQAFPPDIKTIFETQDLTASVFTCPSSNDIPATGPTTRATAQAMLTPGHLSYIYVGGGLTAATVTPDMVLAYEPLTNHSNDGMNVLFGDFSVQWLPAGQAKPLLNQVAAHIWPVRIPPATTKPATNQRTQ
jgi:hypothetical protein